MKLERKKLAIVGCGKLADIVVDALLGGLLADYKLIGTYSKSHPKASGLAQRIREADTGYSCTSCNSISELLNLKPDYIIESASPDAMRELALPALKNGSSIVCLSIGALADEEFYQEVIDTARQHNTRVHLVSGAIGGFDLLRTVSLMEKCTISFATKKGQLSLRKTPIYEEALKRSKSRFFQEMRSRL